MTVAGCRVDGFNKESEVPQPVLFFKNNDVFSRRYIASFIRRSVTKVVTRKKKKEKKEKKKKEKNKKKQKKKRKNKKKKKKKLASLQLLVGDYQLGSAEMKN